MKRKKRPPRVVARESALTIALTAVRLAEARAAILRARRLLSAV